MTARETERMIRVDQAGEYGATRIYAGQLAVMGTRAELAGEVRHMAEQAWSAASQCRRGGRAAASVVAWARLRGMNAVLIGMGSVVTDCACTGPMGVFPSVAGQPFDSLGQHHRTVINT